MRVARALTAGAALAVVLTLAACGSSEQADEPTVLAEPRASGATQFVDVADEVGIDFRQGAFRWDTAPDVAAMQGTGLCWLDYDGDGQLDLFAVNSYAVVEIAQWRRAGGLPETALYRNDGGRFEDVSEDAGANFAIRGTGCVAGDLDADGDTDLYVTTATEQLLLWNDGDGHFSEGARDAGVAAFGWHSGAAIGDVNGDGLPDLVVAGYADVNNPVPDAPGGFPATVLGVRDLLFLNQGDQTFREVGAEAGLEVVRFAHGLGVVLTDVDLDDDLDIYLANDTEPDRLYKNVAWPGGAEADPAHLGFRVEEVAAPANVADPGAGMGVASGDYDEDARPDLFVTNLRGQGHGVFRSADGPPVPSFTDERLSFGPDLFTTSGWGVTWTDLDLDTDLDVVTVNGHVPLTDLVEDAQVPQVFENGTAQGDVARFTDASKRMGIADVGKLNARGSAVADYDNDGDLDVAIAVVGGPLLLLENQGEGGRWLEIELARFTPGTRVTVTLPDGRKLVREVQAGSSYVSSEDPRLHFGLGAAARVTSVEARWPGGSDTRLEDVEANQLLRLEPPEHEAVVTPVAEDYLVPGCVPKRPADDWSVARVWDEALLDSIRRDVPAPTVHARNLFHVSAAMWDAWAAYEPDADGYFVEEKHESDDVEAAREAAISYAAYRVLLHRYSVAAGLEETFTELASTMDDLCYDSDYVSTEGDSPAALGNRIAATVIERGRNDGSLEETRYVDTSYKSVNPPMVVAEPGTKLRDPDRWQPLALAQIVSQNGVPVPGKVQSYIGPHWGHVTSFALPESAQGLPIDPGPAPQLGEPGRRVVQADRAGRDPPALELPRPE